MADSARDASDAPRRRRAAIRPPPRTTSPSYRTAAWPGAAAQTGASVSTIQRPPRRARRGRRPDRAPGSAWRDGGSGRRPGTASRRRRLPGHEGDAARARTSCVSRSSRRPSWIVLRQRIDPAARSAARRAPTPRPCRWPTVYAGRAAVLADLLAVDVEQRAGLAAASPRGRGARRGSRRRARSRSPGSRACRPWRGRARGRPSRTSGFVSSPSGNRACSSWSWRRPYRK